MNKKDLEMYINLVINEEDDKANALMAKIMSEETKKRYRDMLIEDGDLEVIEPESEEEIITNPPEPTEVEIGDDSTSDENSTSDADLKSKINYQFNDISKDMDRLRSMFNELNSDSEGEAEDNSEDSVEEVDVTEDDSDASPLTYANEDENIFADNDKIDESLELSPVKVDGKSSKEVGAGKSVKIDDKSVLDTKAREKKGEPSSSKATPDSNGNGKLEAAPPVMPAPYKSTNVLDLEKVSDKGDEGAELNSKEGFGNEDADSPLSKVKL